MIYKTRFHTDDKTNETMNMEFISYLSNIHKHIYHYPTPDERL